MNAGRPLRTFFAVSPDEATRAALAKGGEWAAKSCGGRPIARDLLHLTLVFIGTTPRDRVPDLAALMDSIEVPPFTLELDTVGWFRRNGIVWAGSASLPDELLSLQSAIARGAERLGFSLDVRPYAPHLTLARDAHRSPPSSTVSPPVRWRVGSFELMSSHLGAGANGSPRYEALHGTPLSSRAPEETLSTQEIQ